MAVEQRYLVSLNLTGNEIRNANLQNLAEAPVVSTTDGGRVYYNTVEKKPKFWDGTQWQDFGEEDTNTTYTFTAHDSEGSKGFTWTSSDGGHGDLILVTVDNEMSDTSTNPVQNSTVKSYVDQLVSQSGLVVHSVTNPAYTITSSKVFVWTVTTTAEDHNKIGSVEVYEVATGEQVYPSIIVSGVTGPVDIIITISGAEGTTIAQNTYIARYIH